MANQPRGVSRLGLLRAPVSGSHVVLASTLSGHEAEDHHPLSRY